MHLENPELAAEFSAAVSRLIPRPPVALGERSPLPEQGQGQGQPSLRATPSLAGDLALNRPGKRAAEAERAARSAAPICSRLARLFDVRTEERSWRIGRKGEEAVAARLARLPADWHTLHSIEVGVNGSDIDHVAIGPGGVYTINAKHHPDANVWVGGETFLVNGYRQSYVRNSRHEAARAARILSRNTGLHVPVVGVIAVMGAHKGFTVKAQPADGTVYVITRKRLDSWLRCRPRVLNATGIATVFDVARCSEIWLG